MDLGLKNKHVLVTGGARGLGLAIARAFQHEGAMVSIFDCDRESLDEIKPGFNCYLCDVSKADHVNAFVDSAEDCIAPIDILVNNAGVASDILFLELPLDEWERVINTNLTGAFIVAQAVAKRMVKRRAGGVIVNMSSKNGLFAETGYAHYNASKFGLLGLTKTMALELAVYGIRVNAVCPGYIVTPMSQKIDMLGFAEQFAERNIPLQILGMMEDVTGAFLFLASKQARWITGQEIVIDGGQLCGQTPGLTEKQRFLRAVNRL